MTLPVEVQEAMNEARRRVARDQYSGEYSAGHSAGMIEGARIALSLPPQGEMIEAMKYAYDKRLWAKTGPNPDDNELIEACARVAQSFIAPKDARIKELEELLTKMHHAFAVDALRGCVAPNEDWRNYENGDGEPIGPRLQKVLDKVARFLSPTTPNNNE